MMASFPRCFPNVDMLHIEFAIADRPTGRHHSNFWWEIHPIGCLNSNVKKIVLHEFRGDQSEFEFLKFTGRSAQELLALLVISTKEKYASADEVNKLTSKLGMLSYAKWASEECLMLICGPRVDNVWGFQKASDLSVDDPFH